jgi:protein ImuB
MRPNQAEVCCQQELAIKPRDLTRERQLDEHVRRSLSDLGPDLAYLGPGLYLMDTRGPTRRLGGENSLVNYARKIAGDALDRFRIGPARTGPARLRWRLAVGIADGRFAATLAALVQQIVPSGHTPIWLANWPVRAIPEPGLAHELARLGIFTLGDLAQFDPTSIGTRFGHAGLSAQELARGVDSPFGLQVPWWLSWPTLGRPTPSRRAGHRYDFKSGQPVVAPADVHTYVVLDPPADHLEAILFAGSRLASQLSDRLGDRGLSAVQIHLSMETEEGATAEAQLNLTESHTGETTISRRIRRQIEGWAANGIISDPVTAVSARAIRTTPTTAVQLDLLGQETSRPEKTERALDRVEDLLGPHSIFQVHPTAHRDPARMFVLVPRHDPKPDSDASRSLGNRPPWPGRPPGPLPTRLLRPEPDIEVLSPGRDPVRVLANGMATSAVAWLALPGVPARAVTAWAGPWPADERWWDADEARRIVHFQAVDGQGNAYLIARHHGQWSLRGIYD